MEVIGIKKLILQDRNDGYIHSVDFTPKNYNFNEHAVSEGSVRKIIVYGDEAGGKTSLINAIKNLHKGDVKTGFSLDTSEGELNFTIDTSTDRINYDFQEEPSNYSQDLLKDIDEWYRDIAVYKGSENVFRDAHCLNKHYFNVKFLQGTDEDLIFTNKGEAVKLYAFIIRSRIERKSMIVIDDFCNNLSDKMACFMLKQLNRTDIPYIITTNKTCLMCNDYLRPDCYYIVHPEMGVRSITELSDKELRESHNLEKLYRSGVFDYESVSYRVPDKKGSLTFID